MRVAASRVPGRATRAAHAPVLVARAGAKTGHILVATDLSDPSLPAVAAAAREARRTGARLTALHCLEPVVLVGGPEPGIALLPAATADFAETLERARMNLGEALQQFGIPGDARVVQGLPAATILAEAEEIGADRLILGTRGRTGLRRVLLGSVAESVVRHAHCSVLVVRLSEGGDDRAAYRLEG